MKRYEQLNFADVAWKDGIQTDVNLRRDVPDEIRGALKAIEGALSGLEREKQKVDVAIKEAGWPQDSRRR